MRKLIALTFVALTMAGGVAVVVVVDTRPALAGCGNNNC